MAYNNSTNSTGIYWSCRDSSSEDLAVMMSIRIYFGATLAFVVVGLVGNVLSMLVFKSREMQGVSSNVYLLTLAASDSCYLVSVFLSKTLTTLHCWYFTELALDIVNRGDTWCVLLQYLCDLFSNNSTCVILAFTVERAVAVFRPMRYKELCTVARARCVCARAASARSSSSRLPPASRPITYCSSVSSSSSTSAPSCGNTRPLSPSSTSSRCSYFG